MPRSIALSKNSATSSGFSPLNSVQLMVTRKPLLRASLIAATALSNTPSWHTDSSWRSPVAVQMDRESQIGRGPVLIDVLGEQDGVGAQIDEFLARHDAGDDLRHLLVDQRLAAGNRDHRRAALVDCAQCILDTDPFLQNLLRIVDLAAARASQIALEQRLQHENQRIALVAAQLAAGQIASRPDTFAKVEWPCAMLPRPGPDTTLRLASSEREQRARGTMIAPYRFPFHHEPRGKS